MLGFDEIWPLFFSSARMATYDMVSSSPIHSSNGLIFNNLVHHLDGNVPRNTSK